MATSPRAGVLRSLFVERQGNRKRKVFQNRIRSKILKKQIINKMRIIVTGGAGFIASHVADAYIKAGHKVIVIDNLATGLRKNINKKAKFYRADIRNLTAIEKIFKREQPEIVNHHAAIAEVVKSMLNPLPTLETNVLGTTSVLIALGKYGKGKRKFIFSSTGGAIYGEPKKIPADETTPEAPLSPYGISKLLGEELIKFYSRHYSFDYLIFRYPNVYGPRQSTGNKNVIPVFVELMRRKKQPTIFGDGTKARDYTYIDDIVKANLIALKKGHLDTVNIGWGKKITDQMIFDAVAKAMNFSGKPIYAPFRKGEVYQIAIDAKKAEKVLGWKPTMELEKGMSKTVYKL
jgi:UDP-glucose 4-epimerase